MEALLSVKLNSRMRWVACNRQLDVDTSLHIGHCESPLQSSQWWTADGGRSSVCGSVWLACPAVIHHKDGGSSKESIDVAEV